MEVPQKRWPEEITDEELMIMMSNSGFTLVSDRMVTEQEAMKDEDLCQPE